MHTPMSDFPLMVNHPEIIYLDSAASAQKPAYVIDGVKAYLEHDYANIHRGLYGLAQRSEEMYRSTKRLVAEWLGGRQEEVVFTSNSTGASNVLVQSLVVSGFLKPGDKIVLSVVEHHANIVPWQMAAQQCGCELVYVGLDASRDISLEDLERVWDDNVKVVALSYVSNVTGKVHRVKEIGDWLRMKRGQSTQGSAAVGGDDSRSQSIDFPLYVVDASQAAPHLYIQVQDVKCDMLYVTGHKFGAFTGIGVLWGRGDLLRKLTPSIGGGSAVRSVSEQAYELQDIPDKFEPGTPNMVGVVSLMKALEYLRIRYATGEPLGEVVDSVLSYRAAKIGEDWSQVYAMIQAQETPLIEHCLAGLMALENEGKLEIVGPRSAQGRIGVFSFMLKGDKNPFHLGQFLADRQVCVRVGGQCAQPFHEKYGVGPTCRASLWVYNTMRDVDIFLAFLREYVYM